MQGGPVDSGRDRGTACSRAISVVNVAGAAAGKG